MHVVLVAPAVLGAATFASRALPSTPAVSCGRFVSVVAFLFIRRTTSTFGRMIKPIKRRFHGPPCWMIKPIEDIGNVNMRREYDIDLASEEMS